MTLREPKQAIAGLTFKTVTGITHHTDNGVPCLKLLIPLMRPVLIHYDNTPAVKMLGNVGVTLDGRFFKMDGQKIDTGIHNVNWRIKYDLTPEGLVNITSLEKTDMAKTKLAPTKATDDTDAKVAILLSRLNGVDKKYHREHEDNSILRDMLCDGYPKVHDWFDLVRLPDYDVDEAERRYDNIHAARADVPVKTTLDEVDKSIEALPPTVANDLPKRDLAASASPDEPRTTDVGPIEELDGYLQRQANGAPNPNPKYTPPTEPKDDWAEFWISAKHLLARIDIPEKGVHQWVHAFYKIDEKKDSLKNLGKTKGDILTEIRKEVDTTLAQWEEDDIESHRLVTKIRNADKPAEEPKVENASISNEKASNLNDAPKSEVKTNAVKIDANLTANSNGTEKAIAIEFTPAPILDEIKTLGGVPLSKLHHVMNRKFSKQYYKSIKAKDGNENGWTDLDPVGVRKRMDKVFGPQGFGWRIVPMQGIGQVVYDGIELQHVKEYVKDGKVIKPAYDRKLHSVSMQCFTFEYALIQDGKIHYVQTSAFSCTCAMDDRDDAYKGAFTGIMKMALKFFSGYDHFMDKAAA